ncbi:hypothetical protein [Enterococcus sp. AZ192]|uniref:hypothetical protein n=1 Tax=unclassified Enterococcus TaxID=2608891 RepID=UPI003D282940
MRQWKIWSIDSIKVIVKYVIPMTAIGISLATFESSKRNSAYSIKVAEKSLKSEENYNKQAEQLLLTTTNYSLAINEVLINQLMHYNDPIKTLEQYSIEHDTASANFSAIKNIDLSLLDSVNLNNTQGFIYYYTKYLSAVDESLDRLKNRSDILKQDIALGKEDRISSAELEKLTENVTKEEILNSEYKVDWLIIEDGSLILQNFVQYLIDSRGILLQIKEGIEDNKKAPGSDIEKTYSEYLEKNEKIIPYSSNGINK